MRALTTAQSTATTGPATAPRYLVRIDLTTGTVYWTTGPRCVWSDAVWSAGGIEVRGLSSRGCAIRVPNHDNAASALVLGDTNDVREAPVSVWAVSGPEPYAADDPQLLFVGAIDGTEIDDWVTLSCVPEGDAVGYSPRVSLGMFLAEDATPPGTKIRWDNTVLILVEANG